MAMLIVGLAMFAQACSLFDVCAPPSVEEVAATDETTIDVVVEPACELPICGPLGTRLYCVEFYESRHFGGAFNPSSGARGWLQWLPGTARVWGVQIGDRYSEWSAAARIAAQGEHFFRSQWVPLQRGYC